MVPEILKAHTGQRMTAREIAEAIMLAYPEECEAKRRASKAKVVPLDTQNALLNQIVSEIGSDRHRLENNHGIKSTEERPRKYYYSSQTDEQEVSVVEAVGNSQLIEAPTKLSEHSLYPLLSEFLFTELGIHTLRIDEKRARNANGPDGNKWLYPDVVGLENLMANWEKDVIECVSVSAANRTKLYSFEVKILLNRSNVRECFFQTVSNSAWAHSAYLVASEIQGAATIEELRVLSGTHGVGVIRLDPQNPSESEIILPARERDNIDWTSANRLASASADFTRFLTLVRQFYQTKDLRPQDWDYRD